MEGWRRFLFFALKVIQYFTTPTLGEALCHSEKREIPHFCWHKILQCSSKNYAKKMPTPCHINLFVISIKCWRLQTARKLTFRQCLPLRVRSRRMSHWLLYQEHILIKLKSQTLRLWKFASRLILGCWMRIWGQKFHMTQAKEILKNSEMRPLSCKGVLGSGWTSPGAILKLVAFKESRNFVKNRFSVCCKII